MNINRNLKNQNTTTTSNNAINSSLFLTVDTTQTVQGIKTFTKNTSFLNNISGSTNSTIFGKDLKLLNSDSKIFINNVQINSSHLSNDSNIVKTGGDFT